MKNLSRNLRFAMILLIGLAMLSGYATNLSSLPQAKPGFYVNEECRFSVTYPENLKARKMLPGEVMRLYNPKGFFPVIASRVADVPPGFVLDENIPKSVIDRNKQIYPKSNNYEITKQKIVKMPDGTPTLEFLIEWNIHDTLKLYSYYKYVVVTLKSPEDLKPIMKDGKEVQKLVAVAVSTASSEGVKQSKEIVNSLTLY